MSVLSLCGSILSLGVFPPTLPPDEDPLEQVIEVASPQLEVPDRWNADLVQPVSAPSGADRVVKSRVDRELGVVVRPSRRTGLERLRRMLPYGVIHDPVIRYLEDGSYHVVGES